MNLHPDNLSLFSDTVHHHYPLQRKTVIYVICNYFYRRTSTWVTLLVFFFFFCLTVSTKVTYRVHVTEHTNIYLYLYQSCVPRQPMSVEQSVVKLGSDEPQVSSSSLSCVRVCTQAGQCLAPVVRPCNTVALACTQLQRTLYYIHTTSYMNSTAGQQRNASCLTHRVNDHIRHQSAISVSDFECGVIIGDRWAGLSFSETVGSPGTTHPPSNPPTHTHKV